MKILYIYIYTSLVFFCNAQNLVPNSSFETFSVCPNNGGQIESAIPWSAATTNSSTDYYNSCSPSHNVPNTPTSFQNAHTGNAIVGLFFAGASSFDLDSREYLQVQLISPLVQNLTYYMEFFVNLHDANSFASACNNISANFSVTQPFTATLGILQPLVPHIMNPGNPIINDRINWIKVSGCYTAQGGEEYLTIGNFFDNANTEFIGTTFSSYYFVDDVLVEEMTGTSVTGITELSTNFNIDVYPNPTDGVLNLKIVDAGKDVEIKITDVLGREVIVSEYKEQLDISQFEKGIYFLSVYKAHNLVGTKKIVKQ